jgi:hypothetical protein
MGETIDALGYKADVKSRAKENVQGKVDTVKEKIAGVGESITGVGESISDKTPDSDQVKGQAKKAVGIAQENPLGLAVGAVAVGFLAGMLIPESRMEHEKLGPMADEVKQQMRDTGHEALEHGKQVAQDAVQGARDAAQESAGEHAGELKDSAAESVRYTKESVGS